MNFDKLLNCLNSDNFGNNNLQTNVYLPHNYA